MVKSKLFYSNRFKKVEKDAIKLLNREPDFLSVRTAPSTRAAGDAIQAIICDHFQELLGDACSEYSADFARRAMADLAFTDSDGLYYRVDVKTHRVETHFNMPNLTSVERLARFYEDDNNYFVFLMVRYSVKGVRVTVDRVHFVPIEFLSWNCLTIGALGWGQIQIANANTINIQPGYSRKKWMLKLCNNMLEFYPREIVKIGKREAYFKKLRQFWERKPE